MKLSLCAAVLAALFACAVQADSMDDANKEGVNAGKAASGTTSADPNGYFDNYSADAPQKDYYKGGTQTDTNIDVAGQTELSTSDLGKTAQESYVNNPADSISYDSDMIKHSDDVRGNAEAIAGGTTGQCVEQEVSKTTYTTHSCVMASDLTQSCSRKATITGKEGTGTETVQIQIDSSSLNVVSDKTATTAIWTVPENETVTGASVAWSWNKKLAFSNDNWMAVISSPFGSFTMNDANGSSALSAGQSLSKGQALTFTFTAKGGGVPFTHWAAANMKYHFVITLTVLRTVKRTVPEITWTDSCPAEMGDAVKLSDTCTSPGGDRTVVMDGISYTLYSDCWEYTQKWMVNEDDTNTCQAYIDDPNCSEGTRTCTQKTGDYCVLQSLTYQCAHTVKSTGYVCGSEFYCSDGSCASMATGQNQNFEEAVSQLAALAAAGKDFAGMDPDKVTAFTGNAMACRKSAAGFSNCCKSGGWGQDTGLAHCNTEEKEIGKAKEKLLTVKVGSYCATKVAGVCLVKKESYCVFDSKLARIVQEQGRRDQLGISFGSGKDPDCRGIKVAELQGIKFDAIDFSDFYADLNSQVALPDQDALTKRIQESISSNLSANGGG